MTKDDIRKLLVSSLTLTLLMGGGFAYGNGRQATVAPDYSDSQAAHQLNLAHAQRFKMSLQLKEHPPFHLYQEAASILGLTKAQLTEAMQSGKSLAELAAQKGISEKEFLAKLSKEWETKLSDAVKSGKLTEERAKQIKTKMAERMNEFIHQKGIKGIHMQPERSLERVADLIGIPAEQLKAELQAGKSLADVAEAHGITKDQLIKKLKDNLTPMLQKYVEHKHSAPAPTSNPAPKK